MSPRPVIYVSHITNLSDARYCAGMGVDLLGFVIDPSDPDFVSAETYQQLIGWVSGPALVVELGASTFNEADYSPEFIHLTFDQLASRKVASARLIVEIQFQRLITLPKELRERKDIAYWLATDAPNDLTEPMITTAPILIARNEFPGGVIAYLKRMGAAGVALRGSIETVPGLKDYDHLSQILEELNA
jgi:phosphoribosylanthranilate isomerase